MSVSLSEHLPLLASAPDGIKKLRGLVLELAVRGRLVPQDPRDEPASSSIRLVGAEARVAMSEGVIKKHGSATPIKHDELPILPKGWEWSCLAEVVHPVPYSIKRGPFGSAIRKDMFVPSGFKVYEQQHAIYGDFSVGRYYINEKKFEELGAFELHPDEVLVSCSGTVGKVAIVPPNIERGIINQALLKLSLHQAAIGNKYFLILFPAYFLQTETLTDLQGTAQKNIPGMDVLKNMPFPLPPLPEQHRIVAKVDELMALCDRMEAEQADAEAAHATLVQTLLGTLTQSRDAAELAANWQRLSQHFDTIFTTEASLDALKQTVLQLAVMGKLVPQDPTDESASELLKRIAVEKARLEAEGKIRKVKLLSEVSEVEKPYELPTKWEWALLRSVAIKVTDGEHISPRKTDQGMPLLTAKDVQDSGVDLSAPQYVSMEDGKRFRERCNPEHGDILICSRGTIGRCTSVETADVFCLMGSVILIKPSREISHRFMLRYLQTDMAQGWMSGISSATAVSALYLKDVATCLLPVPPLDEQHRIVTKVDELMALCDSLKADLAESRTRQARLATTLIESALQAA